jgi:YHS domain-containing protein
MKKLTFIGWGISSLLWISCGSSEPKKATIDSAVSMAQDTSAAMTYDITYVNNKKDPTCGMPVSAGISDTAHYDNKVIGFCSTECKNEFLKNPKAGLAAAELK